MFNTRVDLDLPHVKDFDNKYDPQGAPQLFATYKVPSTPISLGFGIYAPFGFRNRYADDVPFRTLAKEGRIEYLTYNPVVAVQITKTLSVAGGLTINHGTAELVQGVIAPHDEFRFEGDDTTFGFNAGILWHPHPMHSFGINYVSPTRMDFQGESHLKYASSTVSIPVAPGVFVPFTVPGVDRRENADASIDFPQHVTVGYSFRPTPDWNIEANVDWTDWETLDNVILHQEKSGDVTLPFNWRSSFLYELGVTRKFGSFHTSAGYVYSQKSVPNESFNPIIPDGNRHVFSVGIGQQFEHVSWDLAYQYTYGPERYVGQGTLADGNYRFEAHALSLAVGYRF